MPQLVPFYFINEVIFTFAVIAITVYMLSKYILPRFARLFLSRTFISKFHIIYKCNKWEIFLLVSRGGETCSP
uniref:ATP synthase protein 8 n=1 Tax=Cryphonectria parasitica TaxID=5116 RepID=A0A191MXE6_CRYPA|nr:ATP synthase F0 subunit 8 [Cryphonectria parasitica]